ncbi:MAG: hypothetical protein QNJ11_04750 [Woeseiaceae bacterium]|nr:hypothetical protein [Woeseiaceae bacterium]
MSVVASAPGKVVLSGEYAVLDGAPAICMAVNRRAMATVGDSPDGRCRVATPGREFSNGEKFHIVEAVCGSRPELTIELDTRAFAEDGAKLGIGSSAALTAALVAALGGDVYVDALAAHRHLQGGSGSGVDVAAAVHGGLIEYRMRDASVNRLEWPTDLAIRFVWTGTSSSTKARLDRLSASEGRSSRSELRLAADDMADAWRLGDGARVLEAYVPYISVLRRFSVDHDLGIFDAGHEALTDAAGREGLVYKPAGAGGGDIGTLLGPDAVGLDAFIAANAGLVHTVLDCELDRIGVTLEQP